MNKFSSKYFILISIFMENLLISKAKWIIILWRPFVHLTGPAPETASNLTQEQVRGLEVLRDKVLSFYYCNILPLVGWEFFPKFVHRQKKLEKSEMIIDFTEFFYKEWK